jgi:hypothetical protein
MLPEERAGLRKIRRRRLWFWIELATYLPLLLVAEHFTHPPMIVGMLLTLSALALVRFAAGAAFSHCPRCGQYFHSTISTPTFWSLLTRRCLHCGLSLHADRVIYPSME